MGHKVSDGRSVVVTAPAGGVVKDNPYLISGYFGWADADADAGATVSLSIFHEEREVTLPAKTGGWAVGDPVYWTGTAFAAGAGGGANRQVGRVTRAVAAGGGVGWMITGTLFADSTVEMLTVAGGVAGNHTVTGIDATDELMRVLNLADGVNLTSEFTVSAANTINNTGGTDTTGDILLVQWRSVKA